MKKICVMSLGLLACMSLSAQEAVVKDAQKAINSADSYGAYTSAVDKMKPAFENDETKGNAQTYWIPGKQAFKIYDDMSLQQQIGKEVNTVDMANLLLNGYKYGMQALKNDTVVNEKGKVKTKYSKEIAGQIAGHNVDFINAGSALWDARKYPEAYEAFTIWVTNPSNPSLGEYAPKAPADTMLAQIEYFRGLSAWQANMLPEAAASFEKMMELGYDDMAAYDYAYSVAYQMKDEGKMLKYSQIAYDKYGNAKPDFLQRIVQSYINSKDYASAMAILDKAIASDPNNANYYYLQGVLYDDQNNKDKSFELFKKAYELDPEGAMYNFSYGTALLQKAERLEESTGNMAQADYNKFRAETMAPLLKEAAGYLEKAYQLDEENMRNALTNLKIIYYNLNDGENLKRIENLLL